MTDDDLDDLLAEAKQEITELEHELASRPTYDDLIIDLEAEECIRCHHMGALLDGNYCSRSCRLGWTKAPSFEEYYRSLHPLWPEVRGTDPVIAQTGDG